MNGNIIGKVVGITGGVEPRVSILLDPQSAHLGAFVINDGANEIP